MTADECAACGGVSGFHALFCRISGDGAKTGRVSSGDHEVINVMGDWTFRCPAWGMWWRYPNKKTAEFFLSAHLAYPVEPCLGGPVTPEQEDALMEAEKRDV